MDKKILTAPEWNYIVANYFTGYYANNQTLQQRKAQRALYLANKEYYHNILLVLKIVKVQIEFQIRLIYLILYYIFL